MPNSTGMICDCRLQLLPKDYVQACPAELLLGMPDHPSGLSHEKAATADLCCTRLTMTQKRGQARWVVKRSRRHFGLKSAYVCQQMQMSRACMQQLLTNSPGNTESRCKDGVRLRQQYLHDQEYRQILQGVLVRPLGAVELD